MAASEAAVKAAMEVVGCHHGNGNRGCDAHWVGWTDRGCATAVAVADAVAAIAAREALEDAAATLAPPDPHAEDEECETCFTVRWLRGRAEAIR